LVLSFVMGAQAQTGTTSDSYQPTTQSEDKAAPTMDQQATTTAPGMSMESQTTTSDSDAYSNTEGQSNQDYSKNPYWAPQDWGYISNNSDGGG
jgi:hypothetical protein